MYVDFLTSMGKLNKQDDCDKSSIDQIIDIAKIQAEKLPQGDRLLIIEGLDKLVFLGGRGISSVDPIYFWASLINVRKYLSKND